LSQGKTNRLSVIGRGGRLEYRSEQAAAGGRRGQKMGGIERKRNSGRTSYVISPKALLKEPLWRNKKITLRRHRVENREDATRKEEIQ